MIIDNNNVSGDSIILLYLLISKRVNKLKKMTKIYILLLFARGERGLKSTEKNMNCTVHDKMLWRFAMHLNIHWLGMGIGLIFIRFTLCTR